MRGKRMRRHVEDDGHGADRSAEGNDTLVGTTGDDTIIGCGDDGFMDSLTGGGGNDVFVYDSLDFGDDHITDFNNGDARAATADRRRSLTGFR